MPIATFKARLLRLQEDTATSPSNTAQSFLSVKNSLQSLLHEAQASEDVRSICPDYVFATAHSFHSRRDIHSWVTRLLAKMEGHSMPPSQHDATLAQYLGELSPEAAELVSRTARRISDPPEASKKKK